MPSQSQKHILNNRIPYIGAHLSRSKGYVNVFENAVRIGANVIQLFSGSPRSLTRVHDVITTQPKRLEDLLAARDTYVRPTQRKNNPEPNQTTDTTSPNVRLFFHAPYFINLSNPVPKKVQLHAEILRQELEVCELAGGEGVVVHTGKRKASDGQTDESAYKTFVTTVQSALEQFHGTSRVLIETSAGEGNSIGVSVEDFVRLYAGSGFTKTEQRDRLGVVIDTCHVFGSGYDISTAENAAKFIHTLHYIHNLPVSCVKLIHLNDSKGTLGSLTDFHENIGKGHLFANHRMDGLETFMKMYVPHGVPFVLETPSEKNRPAKGKEGGIHMEEIAMCKLVWLNVCKKDAISAEPTDTPSSGKAIATSLQVPDKHLPISRVIRKKTTRTKRPAPNERTMKKVE